MIFFKDCLQIFFPIFFIDRFELSSHYISYRKLFWQISYHKDTLLKGVPNSCWTSRGTNSHRWKWCSKKPRTLPLCYWAIAPLCYCRGSIEYWVQPARLLLFFNSKMYFFHNFVWNVSKSVEMGKVITPARYGWVKLVLGKNRPPKKNVASFFCSYFVSVCSSLRSR